MFETLISRKYWDSKIFPLYGNNINKNWVLVSPAILIAVTNTLFVAKGSHIHFPRCTQWHHCSMVRGDYSKIYTIPRLLTRHSAIIAVFIFQVLSRITLISPDESLFCATAMCPFYFSPTLISFCERLAKTNGGVILRTFLSVERCDGLLPAWRPTTCSKGQQKYILKVNWTQIGFFSNIV